MNKEFWIEAEEQWISDFIEKHSREPFVYEIKNAKPEIEIIYQDILGFMNEAFKEMTEENL